MAVWPALIIIGLGYTVAELKQIHLDLLNMAATTNLLKTDFASITSDFTTMKTHLASTATKQDLTNMATKADLIDLATKTDFTNMTSDFTTMKADLANIAEHAEKIDVELGNVVSSALLTSNRFNDIALNVKKLPTHEAVMYAVNDARAVRSKIVHLQLTTPFASYGAPTNNTRPLPPAPVAEPITLAFTPPPAIPASYPQWVFEFVGVTPASRAEAANRSIWLEFRSDNHQTSSCNGVVFERDKVLTAAHCVAGFWQATSNRLVRIKLLGQPPTENVTLKDVLVNPKHAGFLQGLDSSRGLDVALLHFAEPLEPSERTPPQIAIPTLESSQVLHTVFLADDGSFQEFSTIWNCNRFDLDHSWYQGPGRTGHSGSGVYDSRGRLLGLVSESLLPAAAISGRLPE